MIKPGDLLFVWGDSFIENGIEWVTHGPSHVAMFKNENTLIEAQTGRPVGEIDLSFYLGKKCRLEVWEDPTLTDPERTEMINFARTLYGTEYDDFLIPLELLHFECGLDLHWYHEKNRRICSTLMDQIGKYVNRKWSQVMNPAPVDLTDGGILTFKELLKSE
jgi:hypothetical protein